MRPLLLALPLALLLRCRCWAEVLHTTIVLLSLLCGRCMRKPFGHAIPFPGTLYIQRQNAFRENAHSIHTAGLTSLLASPPAVLLAFTTAAVSSSTAGNACSCCCHVAALLGVSPEGLPASRELCLAAATPGDAPAPVSASLPYTRRSE